MDKRYKIMSKEELLEEFKKEYIRLNYPVKMSFDKNRSKGFPCSDCLEKKLELKWNALLEECNFKLHYVNNKDVEYYKEKILKLAEELQRTPTKLEIEKNIGSFRAVCKAFNVNTYNNVLEVLNLEKNLNSKQEFTREELKDYYIDLSNKLGYPARAEECREKIYYIYKEFNGSLKKLREECGYYKSYHNRKLKYSNKELDKILIAIYKKYKRLPKSTELEEELKKNNYCSMTTLVTRYNSGKIEVMFKKALEYNYFRNNIYAKEKIIQLYKEGMEVKEISTLVKTNRTTIYSILKANNIDTGRKKEATKRQLKAIEMYKEGYDLKEIDNTLYNGKRTTEGFIYKYVDSNRYKKNK